jgi:hypothetical protein
MKKSLLFFNLIFVILSCNNSKINEENQTDIININNYLNQEIQEKYLLLKSIKGSEYYYMADSIYYNGNSIIESLYNNKPNFDLINKFYQEVNSIESPKLKNIEFNNKNVGDDNLVNYEINKIRILQSQYLNKILTFILQSNFQVDLIGIKINDCSENKSYKAGNSYDLNLNIFYNSSYIKNSKVIIEDDTIETDGVNFKYLYHCKKSGKQLIEAKIVTERWGTVNSYKTGFVVGK